MYQNVNDSHFWVVSVRMIFTFYFGYFPILCSGHRLLLKPETMLFLKASREFITSTRMV